jgi:hypothetical protein
MTVTPVKPNSQPEPSIKEQEPSRSPQKYHIVTFGCQMNKADSERMAGVLENIGYTATDDANDADLVLYNTCSIRDNAEQKVYSYLGRQAKRKHRTAGLNSGGGRLCGSAGRTKR